jgi:hypothetical protein
MNFRLLWLLFLLAGCSRNLGQLRSIKGGLQVELADKEKIAETLTRKRADLDRLQQQEASELANAGVALSDLHVTVPTSPAAVAVPMPPLPEESRWEGVEGARLRAEIALLQARMGELDSLVAMVRDLDKQTAEANATLKAIADLKRARGTDQANEAQ